MEKETSEIVCILTNKEKEEFITIVGVDEWDGYVEHRVNDRKPFGYPLELIEEGCIFIITTEITPGTMICRIDEGEISQYTKVLSNEKLINFLEDEGYEVNIKNLHKRVEELRNKKIETVING